MKKRKLLHSTEAQNSEIVERRRESASNCRKSLQLCYSGDVLIESGGKNNNGEFFSVIRQRYHIMYQ